MKLIKPNYFWMTLMQLMLPVYLALAIYSGAGVGWWIAAFVFYFLYLCVGNNIGLHRYYSHRYFKTNKLIEYFIGWCSTMACLGSPISYVAVHNIHHRHADDPDLDPHGRARSWKSILFCYHRFIHPQDMIFSKNLADLLKRYHILHEYYWLWVFGCASLFYLIGGWYALLFCWLLPASLTLWIVALVLLLQHDDNGPSNTKSYMWFGFGETWHKNHHRDASKANHADPGGIDITYEITKLLSK